MSSDDNAMIFIYLLSSSFLFLMNMLFVLSHQWDPRSNWVVSGVRWGFLLFDSVIWMKCISLSLSNNSHNRSVWWRVTIDNCLSVYVLDWKTKTLLKELSTSLLFHCCWKVLNPVNWIANSFSNLITPFFVQVSFFTQHTHHTHHTYTFLSYFCLYLYV